MTEWRETKIGKGVKKSNSKQNVRLDNQQDLISKIKKEKEKQRKLLKDIRDEIKKIEQLRISLEGLRTLSSASILNIQKRREKAMIKVSKSVNELSVLAGILKKLENQVMSK